MSWKFRKSVRLARGVRLNLLAVIALLALSSLSQAGAPMRSDDPVLDIVRSMDYANSTYSDGMMDLVILSRNGFAGWSEERLDAFMQVVDAVITMNGLMIKMCNLVIDVKLPELIENTRCRQVAEDLTFIKRKHAEALREMFNQ